MSKDYEPFPPYYSYGGQSTVGSLVHSVSIALKNFNYARIHLCLLSF